MLQKLRRAFLPAFVDSRDAIGAKQSFIETGLRSFREIVVYEFVRDDNATHGSGQPISLPAIPSISRCVLLSNPN